MIAPGGITSFWIPSAQFRNQVVQDVLDRFPNPLSDKEPGWIAQVVNAMNESGDWANTKSLACFAMEDPDNSLTDWVRGIQMTNVSDSVHTANQGYLFDGTADYINTNFIPSTGGLLQDDTLVTAFCYNNLSVVDFDSLFGCSDASHQLRTNQRIGISQFRVWVNSAGVTSEAAGGPYADMTRYGIGRDDSANQEGYRAGSSVASGAVASSGLPTTDMYVGAFNSNGTATNFLNARLSYFHCMIGVTPTSLTNISNELTTLESLFIV